MVAAAVAVAVVLLLGRAGSKPSGANAGPVSSTLTLSGVINDSTTVEHTYRCPEDVTLIDRSGTEYYFALGGPAHDGTLSATDRALNLLSLSNTDLTTYWFSIDSVGSYQGVGQGATGTVSRSGKVYSIDATLVPWTRIAPKTSGNLHIKGSVSC